MSRTDSLLVLVHVRPAVSRIVHRQCGTPFFFRQLPKAVRLLEIVDQKIFFVINVYMKNRKGHGTVISFHFLPLILDREKIKFFLLFGMSLHG